MEMMVRVKRLVPPPVRAAVRRSRYLLLDLQDLGDKVAGKHNPLIAPRRMRLGITPCDFEQSGKHDLELFKTLAGLKPEESVLEIGCGPGRMAAALSRFLNGEGSYEGMDIVDTSIRWCNNHITPRYPRFHFEHSDVFNEAYNPGGRVAARDYNFPYPDNTFDFVFLISVFTHMLPEDMKHYLDEITRVMKAGARCLTTFFLLNPESLNMVQAGWAAFNFANCFGEYRTETAVAESAVAYNETFIRQVYLNCGLGLIEPILYGSWCGRHNSLVFQDFVLATRTSNSTPSSTSSDLLGKVG
jgi:ubiquinone/menaquinone biosynthesis C-methylase UbiE